MGRMIWDKKRIWGLTFFGLAIVFMVLGLEMGLHVYWPLFLLGILYPLFAVVGLNLIVNKKVW